MMNVHRLATLSVSTVILAACSSGGSSSLAPKPVSTQPSSTAATNRKANAVLNLAFAKNVVHITRKNPTGTKSAKRSPKFVDPIEGSYIEVSVYNAETGTTYMAVTDQSVQATATGAQSIPLYLAPGTDTVTVAESEGQLGGGSSGYLLAQGATTIDIAEGSTNDVTNGLSLTMQLVQGTVFTQGPALVYDLTNFYAYGQTMSTNVTSPPILCVNNNSLLLALATDEYGTSSFTQSNPPGDSTPGSGVPTPYQFSFNSQGTGGTSTLVPSPTAGYVVAFDSNGDRISLEADYSMSLDPGSFSLPLSYVDPQNISYYAILANSATDSICGG
jgi:hypothetical protein